MEQCIKMSDYWEKKSKAKKTDKNIQIVFFGRKT